jgi:hypothetical protein
MPALQRGEVFRREGRAWAYRYFENGRRRTVGGFKTKGEASDALDRALDVARTGVVARPDTTLGELVHEYLEQHVAEENTLATLRYALRHATTTFGTTRVDRLRVNELRAWRKRLTGNTAYPATKALRQVLAYAVDCGYVPENIAKKVPNPEPKRPEVLGFDDWPEVEAVAEELGSPPSTSSPRASTRGSSSRARVAAT